MVTRVVFFWRARESCGDVLPGRERGNVAVEGRTVAWRSLAGPVLALALLVAAAQVAGPQWHTWQARLAGLGAWAPAAYLLVWMALVPCGFPAAALGLLAGAIFGPWWGAALATTGLCGSGLVMYGLGRRWLKPRLARLGEGRPRLKALGAAAATGPVRLHLLARLSPLNYALVSYTLAAGGAPLGVYAKGLCGGVPGLLAYVWLGSLAGGGPHGPGEGSAVRWVVLAVGVAALLVLGIRVGRTLARLTGESGSAAGPDA